MMVEGKGLGVCEVEGVSSAGSGASIMRACSDSHSDVRDPGLGKPFSVLDFKLSCGGLVLSVSTPGWSVLSFGLIPWIASCNLE